MLATAASNSYACHIKRDCVVTRQAMRVCTVAAEANATCCGRRHSADPCSAHRGTQNALERVHRIPAVTVQGAAARPLSGELGAREPPSTRACTASPASHADRSSRMRQCASPSMPVASTSPAFCRWTRSRRRNKPNTWKNAGAHADGHIGDGAAQLIENNVASTQGVHAPPTPPSMPKVSGQRRVRPPSRRSRAGMAVESSRVGTWSPA